MSPLLRCFPPLLIVLLLAMACDRGGEGHDGDLGMGGEAQPCYPNNSCNAGLTCLSGVCVDPGWTPDAGGPGPDTTCTPDCAGSVCGDDGCGGSCGLCGSGAFCVDGACKTGECQKDCSDLDCGPDPVCSQSCGTCEDGFTCQDGNCLPDGCPPACDGKTCGPDGCGGSCGSCAEDEDCVDGQCIPQGCEGPGCPEDFAWDARWQGFWMVEVEGDCLIAKDCPLDGGLWLLGVDDEGQVHLGPGHLRLQGTNPDGQGEVALSSSWSQVYAGEPWWEPGESLGEVVVTATGSAVLSEVTPKDPAAPDLHLWGSVEIALVPEPVVTCAELGWDPCPPCSSETGGYPCEASSHAVTFAGTKLHPVRGPYLLHNSYQPADTACMPFDEYLLPGVLLKDTGGQHHWLFGGALVPVDWDPVTHEIAGVACASLDGGGVYKTIVEGSLGDSVVQFHRWGLSDDTCDAEKGSAEARLYTGVPADLFGAYRIGQTTVVEGDAIDGDLWAIDEPVFEVIVRDGAGMITGWGPLVRKNVGVYAQPWSEPDTLLADVPPLIGVVGNWSQNNSIPGAIWYSDCAEVPPTDVCVPLSLFLQASAASFQLERGEHGATCTQLCTPKADGILKICDGDVLEVSEDAVRTVAAGTGLVMENLAP